MTLVETNDTFYNSFRLIVEEEILNCDCLFGNCSKDIARMMEAFLVDLC